MGRRRKPWLWGKTGRRPGRKGYYVRWNEYRGGRRICRALQFRTLANARAFIAKVMRDDDLRRAGQLVPIGLRPAVREFILACAALARQTRVQYAVACGMLAGLWPGLAVGEFQGAHLDHFVASRLARSRPATVRKHLAGLHRFFGWAIKRGYAHHNPVDDVTAKPRAAPPRIRPAVTDEQIARLVSCLDTEDRRLAVWLAITTGLDRMRIVTLSAADVDPVARVIRIVRPKTGRMVTVPIHPALMPHLAERLGRTLPGTPLLHGLTRQDRDRDWWAIATEAAGLQGVWFRDLRAVAATRLQRDAGASLRDAQELLGHASPATTARHYYVPSTELRSALARLPIPGLPGTPAS